MRDRLNVYFRRIIGGMCLLLFTQTSSMLFSQAPLPVNPQVDTGQPIPVDTGQPVEVIPANELDSLVAPIALYPDPLVSQILVASTYPLELVQASQWVLRNPGLTGPALTQAAQAQNWDPSVQALVMFPDLMKRMTDDVAWTTNLGNAFLAQQGDVMNAIQRMRVSAEQAGKLASTPQQQVVNSTQNGQPEVLITPVNPEIIYVPEYDPYWVWGSPVYYPYPGWYYPRRAGFYFGSGISVGFFLGGGWGGWGGWGWHPSWGGRTVIVNNTFIHRNNFNSTRVAGFTGTSVWSHDAFHRQGVAYPRAALNQQQFRSQVRQNFTARTVAPASAQAQPRSFAQSRPAAPVATPRAVQGQTFRAAPAPTQRATPMQRATPAQTMRDRTSAYGAVQNGNSARLQANRGYSNFAQARPAAPMARSVAPPSSGHSAGHSAPSSRGGGGGGRSSGRARS